MGGTRGEYRSLFVAAASCQWQQLAANHIPYLLYLVNTLIPSSSGRWFAAHLLKLMVAYITLHYDIQPLQSRPANQIFGDTLVPSTSTTLKVRRRKLEVAES